ncbi:MAG: MFS transporter [Anaerolineae bacterium]
MTESTDRPRAAEEDVARPEPLGPDGATPPPDYAWNARMFAGEATFFFIGMSFIGATTVIPALVALLSDSKVMVGLASGIGTGAWLLPQLFIAGAVARMRRKRPLILWAAWLTRPVMLVAAFFIWRLGATQPTWTLIAVLASITIFYVGDAVASVPWFDLFALTIPATRRGRVMGIAQVISGIGGVGVGLVVGYVLGESNPWGYPANYALLFVTASVGFLLSSIVLSLLREPAHAATESAPPSVREVVAMMPNIMVHDRPFLLMNVVRLLGSSVSMASSFYVLYALQELGMHPSYAGSFVSAQVIGSLASGLLMAYLQDHLGPVVHLRIVLILSLLPAALALAIGLAAPSSGDTVLVPYLLLYVLLGISSGSGSWPYLNWMLEYADDRRRPLYIGIGNTLGAATMLAPLLGGWIVTNASYVATFAVALGLGVAALALSARLPDTRKIIER